MKPNDGGPAFPNDETIEGAIHSIGGMSLRDWFAGQALSGLLAQHKLSIPPLFGKTKASPEPVYCAGFIASGGPENNDCQFLAKDAYAIADAMLAARERKVE